MSSKRALHFVLKISEREKTMDFFRNTLKMTPLRHEEFKEGCAAACNGPYDNQWSKTMIGYGDEDTHFVVELTYNYTIGSYKLGNDFLGLTVTVPDSHFANLEKIDENKKGYVTAPDGYKFYYEKGESFGVKNVQLACSSLSDSVSYWKDLLKMPVIKMDGGSAFLQYDKDQATLQLTETTAKIDHATAFGRIAFSLPADDLPPLEEEVKKAGKTILTPYVKLDTPGKASVVVVILADPDGHEICFVGDEAFRELSAVDPKASELLDKAIQEDGSAAWYAKKGKQKTDA